MKTSKVGGDNATTIAYTYDANRNPATVADPSLGQLTYEYNGFGEMTYSATPRDTATYTYDALDRMVTRTGLDGYSHWQYDVAFKGTLSYTYYEPVSGPTVSERYTYDRLGKLIQQGQQVGFEDNGQDIFGQACFWRATGNLASRADMKLNFVKSFTYDRFNRLTSASVEPLSKPSYNNDSYNYDTKGNVVQKDGVGVYAYEHETNPYAVTGMSPNPLVIDRLTDQSVAYTPFDKVRSVTQNGRTLTVDYGIDRQRVVQTIDDGNSRRAKRHFTPLYETVTENGVTKKMHYLTSASGLFAIFVGTSNNGGIMYHTIKDHQGSLAATVHGNTVERLSYDPWGRRRNTTDFGYDNVSHTFDRGYTLHEHYDGFDLINMNGRLYDPILGRMLSPDIVVQDEQNSQAYNRYSYCFNNPLRYTDPSGYVVRGSRNYFDWNSMVYYDFGNYRSNGSAFNTELSEGKAIPVHDNFTVDDEGYIKLVEKTNDNFDVIYTKDSWDKGKKDNYIIVDKNVLSKKKTNSAEGVNGKKYSFDMYSVNDDITSKDLFEFLANNTKVEWSQTFIGFNNSGKSIISTSHIRNAEAGQGYLLSNGWTIHGHNHSHPFSMKASKSDLNWANSVQTKFPNVKLQIYFKGEYFEYDKYGILNLPFSNIPEVIIKPEDK